MLIQKRYTFGFGTIFSLIVVYFVFLYSRNNEWTLLAFISKWYLIIVGSIIAFSVGIILLIVLLALLMLLIAALRPNSFGKAYKKDKKYVDVEYKVKE